MIDLSRELIAYGIICLVIMVTIPVLVQFLRRRRRRLLRQRGIKKYDR
jgi:hypothetical protein